MDDNTPQTEANTPPKPSARQFRGQFMDMVHPSSDVTNLAKPNRAQEAYSQPQEPLAEEAANEEKLDETTATIEETTADDGEVGEVKEEMITEESTPEEAENNEDDAYTSPFLPDAAERVADQKRSLSGTPRSVADWLNGFTESVDDLPLELPADEGGKGELELALPENASAEQPTETTPEESDEPQVPKEEPTSPASASAPTSPYEAAATEVGAPVKKHKTPLWTWAAILVLAVVAGIGVGAWVYLSGIIK